MATGRVSTPLLICFSGCEKDERASPCHGAYRVENKIHEVEQPLGDKELMYLIHKTKNDTDGYGPQE